MHQEPGALRVTYVSHVARPSGAEIALERLIRALGERVEPTVILFESGPMARRLTAAGADVRVVPLPKRVVEARKGEHGLALVGALAGSTAYVLRLSRIIRALKPDVVHANSLKAGVLGGSAARLAGRPLVWHVHDRVAPDYLQSRSVRPMRLLVRTLPNAVIANSRATL